MLRKYLCAAAGILALALAVPPLVAARDRDYISIVGSSTVYPFATTVAEQFGKTTRFRTPTIESTGTGGGMKLFCAGLGLDTPDITNASRRITKSEYGTCLKNGVRDITEVKIGYDGIVLANSRLAPRMRLSEKDIFLALAAQVPAPGGGEKLVPNPYRTWKELDPALPDTRIEVLGPPPTSGTRDAFVELAMQGGCSGFAWIRALEKSDNRRFRGICQAIREDGAYIEAGENDDLIVQKLEADPEALGIFGFSFLDQNGDRIQGSLVNGRAPTAANIAGGSYPLSRPLFFYVKVAHVGVIPGMRDYIAEFTSERAWGDDGYLADKGLVPMSAGERRRYAADARVLKPLILE